MQLHHYVLIALVAVTVLGAFVGRVIETRRYRRQLAKARPVSVEPVRFERESEVSHQLRLLREQHEWEQRLYGPSATHLKRVEAWELAQAREAHALESVRA